MRSELPFSLRADPALEVRPDVASLSLHFGDMIEDLNEGLNRVSGTCQNGQGYVVGLLLVLTLPFFRTFASLAVYFTRL